MVASMMISVEPNQSCVSPRSSISCRPAIPSANTPKPTQSNFMPDCAVVFGSNAAMPAVASRPNGRLTKNTQRQS